MTIDILLFQAGADTFVNNDSMNKFFISLNSKYSKLVKFPSAYHELLVEADDIFNDIKQEISIFLSQKDQINDNSNSNKVSNIKVISSHDSTIMNNNPSQSKQSKNENKEL